VELDVGTGHNLSQTPSECKQTQANASQRQKMIGYKTESLFNIAIATRKHGSESIYARSIQIQCPIETQ
jgi:hypothetical protein